MVAGVERYLQIARCFRDEDLRSDRQMEFTQIDVEVSFIDREAFTRCSRGCSRRSGRTSRRGPADAVSAAGVQGRDEPLRRRQPDTRFGLELADFTETSEVHVQVFASTAAAGGAVKALNARGLADITQGELSALEEVAKSLGAKGLAFIKAEGGEWKSPIVKFFNAAEKAELAQRLAIADGDIVFFAAAPWEKACSILGRIRLECAALLQKRGKLSVRPISGTSSGSSIFR